MNSLGRSPSENFIAFIYYVTINIFDIGAVTKDRFPPRAIFFTFSDSNISKMLLPPK
jgi:hypothetical protein